MSSEHRLQKFNSSGELIKGVSWRRDIFGDFYDPHGVALNGNQVYVCDRQKHSVKVFDLNLKFIQSIGSQGSWKEEFERPIDVAFDTGGNMYI